MSLIVATSTSRWRHSKLLLPLYLDDSEPNRTEGHELIAWRKDESGPELAELRAAHVLVDTRAAHRTRPAGVSSLHQTACRERKARKQASPGSGR